MKTFVVCLMYAPMLPVGLLIGTIGIFVDYWVSKILLLRRHTRPLRLSSDLSNAMMRIIPFTVFMYALMTYVFNFVLESDSSAAALVMVWIMVAAIFIPVNTLCKCCRKTDLSEFKTLYGEESNYEKEAIYFHEDYDRVNPVTKQEGMEFYRQLLEKQGTEEANKILQTAFNNTNYVAPAANNRGTNYYNNIMNYAGSTGSMHRQANMVYSNPMAFRPINFA
jgi:uncharacterized membrane protein (GlpM family)